MLPECLDQENPSVVEVAEQRQDLAMPTQQVATQDIRMSQRIELDDHVLIDEIERFGVRTRFAQQIYNPTCQLRAQPAQLSYLGEMSQQRIDVGNE